MKCCAPFNSSMWNLNKRIQAYQGETIFSTYLCCRSKSALCRPDFNIRRNCIAYSRNWDEGCENQMSIIVAKSKLLIIVRSIAIECWFLTGTSNRCVLPNRSLVNEIPAAPIFVRAPPFYLMRTIRQVCSLIFPAEFKVCKLTFEMSVWNYCSANIEDMGENVKMSLKTHIM